jgi:hypothetical protein
MADKGVAVGVQFVPCAADFAIVIVALENHTIMKDGHRKSIVFGL